MTPDVPWQIRFERLVVRFAIAAPCVVLAIFLVALLAKPGITADEHRLAVAGEFPEHAPTGTEVVPPWKQKYVCWEERKAWLKRRYGIEFTNDYVSLFAFELSRVNCLLH